MRGSVLVSGDDPCGGRLATAARPAVADMAVFDPNIAAFSVGCHFTGQYCLVLAAAINGAVGQAQVADLGVRPKLAEQAGGQIGDGVTATVVVSVKGNLRFCAVMAEALVLQIIGIRRIPWLADLAQRFAVVHYDGVLR